MTAGGGQERQFVTWAVNAVDLLVGRGCGQQQPNPSRYLARRGSAGAGTASLHSSTRRQLKRQIVSVARIRLASRKFEQPFKEIICDDISEFESYMPSQAVRSPRANM